MGEETTYWGVLCRTCQDLVAFDTHPTMSLAWEVQTSGPEQSAAPTATITSTSHAISASFLPQSRSPQRPSKKIVRRIWL
jgi:hypothetical protein